MLFISVIIACKKQACIVWPSYHCIVYDFMYNQAHYLEWGKKEKPLKGLQDKPQGQAKKGRSLLDTKTCHHLAYISVFSLVKNGLLRKST